MQALTTSLLFLVVNLRLRPCRSSVKVAWVLLTRHVYSKDFGQLSANNYTWTVDLASGTSVSLKVTDSTGAINYDQAVTIREACLPINEDG